MTPDKKRRKAGRPPGSIDQVLKGREFGLDHFAAVKSFLLGLDPLSATKRYMMADDAPQSSEAALKQVGHYMLLIAERGRTRRHGPDEAQNEANRRAAQAVEKAGLACMEVLSKLVDQRKAEKKAKQADQQAKADKLGLKLVPRGQMPKPPSRFDNLRAFDDWYDDTYRPDELPDQLELKAAFEEHLCTWYAEQGYYYEPDHSSSQNKFSEQLPMRATQLDNTPSPWQIDQDVRRAAARHIDALQWTINKVPEASDHIEAWIDGTTKDALVAGDIFTLYSLSDHIKRHGASWWKHVKGLGPSRAERLKNWLTEVRVQGVGLSEEHFESIQYRRMVEVKRFHERSPAPPSLREFELEPLAPYLIDPGLNGSTGVFRHSGPNVLKAENDIEAIVAALSKYKDKKHTLKLYAREVCRFCLWAYQIKNTPLSSLGVEDAREYREFLGAIPAEWISATKDAPPRGSSDWRPFRGQLDQVSQRKALTAVNVIIRQLMEGGYLTGNPMAGVLKHAELSKPKMDVMRAFSNEQWALVRELLDAQAPSPASRRLRSLMYTLYETGLRREELFKARMGHIDKTRVDGEIEHILRVTGKRAKERIVPVPGYVMALIEDHLHDRPPLFHDDRSSKEGLLRIPLISVIGNTVKAYQIADQDSEGADRNGVVLDERSNASAHGALSPDGMKYILQRFLVKCTDTAVSRGMPRDTFASATLHWLRHTFGHTMADANVDLRVVQKAMGHADINMTAHYSKAGVEQMVRDLRQGRATAATPLLTSHQEASKRHQLADGQDQFPRGNWLHTAQEDRATPEIPQRKVAP